MLARSGEITDPCPVPISLFVTIPSSMTPTFNHFWIRWMMRLSVPDLIRGPVLDELDQPFLADRVEEAPDVGVQYEVHFSALDPDHKGVQRIVLAALGPEPIAEPEEVFL